MNRNNRNYWPKQARRADLPNEPCKYSLQLQEEKENPILVVLGVIATGIVLAFILVSSI